VGFGTTDVLAHVNRVVIRSPHLNRSATDPLALVESIAGYTKMVIWSTMGYKVSPHACL